MGISFPAHKRIIYSGLLLRQKRGYIYRSPDFNHKLGITAYLEQSVDLD
jgi:hypothetical protein